MPSDLCLERLRLNATKTVLFGCPKGREVGLSGGPFAWASSVDGKLRSERYARAGLLLLATHLYMEKFIHAVFSNLRLACVGALESLTCVRGCILNFRELGVG